MSKKFVQSTRALAVVAAVAAGLALTGCAQGEEAPASTDAAAVVVEAGPVSITDPWIKAIDLEKSDHAMTGAFGTVKNDSDKDVRIVGASAEIAGMVELHETVVDADGSSVMQEVEGGFVIPAGESLELKPGGDHIMLMKLDKSIMPGDEVVVTIEFEGGETAELTMTAKEYTGGMETYAPDGSMGNNPHGGGDMDGSGEGMHNQDPEETDK